MMNIQNLGSKEKVAVKVKDSICAELCLKLWFESNWYFCDFTESGYGFESDYPETKFQIITSQSQYEKVTV